MPNSGTFIIICSYMFSSGFIDSGFTLTDHLLIYFIILRDRNKPLRIPANGSSHSFLLSSEKVLAERGERGFLDSILFTSLIFLVVFLPGSKMKSHRWKVWYQCNGVSLGT